MAANNVFNFYKELHEIVMGGELDDMDAPVKVIVAGVEYIVTDSELVTNTEDDSQVLWLNVVEE